MQTPHCKILEFSPYTSQQMSSRINHDGVIDKIEVDTIHVRILQTSACAACGLARHCNSSESKEKMVEVHADGAEYAVGEHVVVSVSAAIGYRAVMLGFGLPFLLLVAVVAGLYAFTANEPLSALSGLLSLAPYYLLLYLFRNRVGQSLAVSITKKTN